METSGRGRGRQRAVLRALGGVPTRSGRTFRVKATTHAARAKSGGSAGSGFWLFDTM